MNDDLTPAEIFAVLFGLLIAIPILWMINQIEKRMPSSWLNSRTASLERTRAHSVGWHKDSGSGK